MVDPCKLDPHCNHRFCIQCIDLMLATAAAKKASPSYDEDNDESWCITCETWIPHDFQGKIDSEY